MSIEGDRYSGGDGGVCIRMCVHEDRVTPSATK